jgi:hypothetical protein
MTCLFELKEFDWSIEYLRRGPGDLLDVRSWSIQNTVNMSHIYDTYLLSPTF